VTAPFWAAEHWCQEESGKGLATASIAGHFVNQDAEEKHREATDKQDEILAELRRIRDRLDRLEAGS